METGRAGEVVIVTGATANVGRGIALAFAEEGARVVVVGRDRNGGGRDARFGQIDVLVNNVGEMGHSGSRGWILRTGAEEPQLVARIRVDASTGDMFTRGPHREGSQGRTQAARIGSLDGPVNRRRQSRRKPASVGSPGDSRPHLAAFLTENLRP